MKKVLFLVLLLCLCFSPCYAANNERLLHLASDEYSSTYLDTASIEVIRFIEKDDKVNTLATITKYVFINDEGQSIYYLNPPKTPNVTHISVKRQYDELLRKSKLLEIIYFDKDNHVLRISYAKTPDWSDIIHGTEGETMFNKIFDYIHSTKGE